jgi:hypothetical protein
MTDAVKAASATLAMLVAAAGAFSGVSMSVRVDVTV